MPVEELWCTLSTTIDHSTIGTPHAAILASAANGPSIP